MRRARIKADPEKEVGVYHVISRTVNGEWLLGPAAKEVLRRQMWRVAEFSGLEILTYVILSNHFHLLVRVPRRTELTDEELLRRYAILYPKSTKYEVRQLEAIKALLANNTPEADTWRKRQTSLMYDLSQFMKLLKERFSIWYNSRHQRFGPVWSDRFKSVLLEPRGRVIRTIATYIDLNCVRAGIVSDPKDYRFCGYAEAVGGHAVAQRGLQAVLGGAWSEAQQRYRSLLFTSGAGTKTGKAAVTPEQLCKTLGEGGTMALADVLRCRVRYFTEGAVLGGREFVDRHVAAYKVRFRLTDRVVRQDLPPAEWGELAGLRPLRGGLFG